MPQHLVIGNGKILMTMDHTAQIRDIFFPYVGQLDHVGGHYCAVGFWVDRQMVWLRDPGWSMKIGYHQRSLVTQVEARHPQLGLTVLMEDGVHQRHNIYLKRLTVRNDAGQPREVRVFFNNDLMINESAVGDTAVYDPDRHVLFHYKRDTYFLFNGVSPAGPMYEFSTGVKRFQHAEGTWRDADDGHLMGNAIAQGSVDSTMSFRLFLGAGESQVMHYWMTIGHTLREVQSLDAYVLDNDPGALLDRIGVYWARWVDKSHRDFADLPPAIEDLFDTSLLVVRAHTDQRGGIVASADSDIMQYNRDHYRYVWPRDGALVAIAMSQAGYHGMINPFFSFCANALSPDGYLYHKYNLDGTIGSSWHPYLEGTERRLPIQEDETGLVLYALWEDFAVHGEIEFPQSLLDTLLRAAANFLARFVDPVLGLPNPSYDLWEERFGIFTFTTAAVYAGLVAAANFMWLYGNDQAGAYYQETADKIRTGMLTHLYDDESGRFCRGLVRDQNRWVKDMTVDSSLYAVHAFGVLPPTDPRVIRTMEAIRQHLTVKTSVGGIARYQGDHYFRAHADTDIVPGNPWIISTLWVADWEIDKASRIEELASARDALQWVLRYKMESGILAEQLDPMTGAPRSVAPLTWSHGTLVATVLRYVKKYRQLLATAPPAAR